jgi:hypothetical protein
MSFFSSLQKEKSGTLTALFSLIEFCKILLRNFYSPVCCKPE